MSSFILVFKLSYSLDVFLLFRSEFFACYIYSVLQFDDLILVH